MFETIPMNVFTIYMSNFDLACKQGKAADGSVTITFTTNNSYETDGEYQLQISISPIALLDDSA